ncbi:MAG: serine/threonine-protein kinase, partial [Polyangiales bacterium]
MPERDDIISEKYRICEPLGAGAMGIVFSAVHLETEKQVALKWLNPALSSYPSTVERFKREAKATGRIHHPNVVVIHDCGEHLGQVYLVMELLTGRTLRARLNAAPSGKLSLDEALELMFPIMRGVAAAHAAGVLHRDLKPENVFLAESPDGLPTVPKVLDFGVAKLQRDTQFAPQLSMPGSVLGTFQYMAPEQLRTETNLDEGVDIFALGAILYEMLLGAPPYQADNPVDLALQLLDAEAPSLQSRDPAHSQALSDVVARALLRERGQRYASVEDFATALEALSEHHCFRGPSRAMPSSQPGLPAPHAATQAANTPLSEAALVAGSGHAQNADPPAGSPPMAAAPFAAVSGAL